jgi:hypothetical protein
MINPELVVEYNSFNKDQSPLEKMFGDRNRHYIIENPDEYLDKMDKI